MVNAQAAILRSKDGPYVLEELVLDEPGSGQVVVDIVASGFCHTDMMPRGEEFPVSPPVVLGHEGAGVVSQVGPDVTDVAVGDHVVITFASCGRCNECISGHPAYCETFMERQLFWRSAGGGPGATDAQGHPVSARFFGQSSFATRTIVDPTNLIRVDPSLDLSVLAPLGCGMITGAGSVFNVFDVQPGTSITIFGAGAVGLAALMAAKAAGATTIIAVDLHAQRLELASELGATTTILGDSSDLVEQIHKASDGGTHYSFDTTGVPSVILAAIRALRGRGMCAHVGQAGDLVLDGDILFGKKLVSVIEGDANPQELIPRLIALWQDGLFPFDRLIRRFPLADINVAEQESHSGRAIKPVLVMPSM
ncbi:NAD(P)-dependent alcohol dehydrogenase [Gordonia sp. KTR9]|uniref:NAD(P)-dependent alcohol dehydrogenase n=1 Tax=Gordonia sp. KTR9 TaxID=337191 RepID=UPI00027DD8A7|nr:NAD(P)-dependent alcohol dehydrogenase [Gordonia sp. KTR9]AFR47383.1 Zn-dependent alcohol dehydrogenase, class III [Gordonia sp. KTR9]